MTEMTMRRRGFLGLMVTAIAGGTTFAAAGVAGAKAVEPDIEIKDRVALKFAP